ncbi:TonB system transport protein ExbD [Aureimonas phyllosphaerae]|uniref:Biopolymer transport protein ExbD n=1 Tax=Aureimonas phyllosphaerae TaxID=1166078 RepID=A0A7W6FV46_9HYPH|nr:TonB system transport protein ExbD [Aureimonas phyllosphaerae]MBB3936899.1 biopolymer transport protein ExbD [Aureimonas phyllosphaerae]MBB3960986.1 biopolymer transport protein ExbD [Aureimonas phyllosphaerae]SFF27197.1 outer membrane transport energization protein ExbD [Aureimonas phyllosphaerae]
MGVSLKSSDDDDSGEVSEINVTPFIDVVLVLLIIFMVAAPLSTVDVPVDLPVSNALPQPRTDEPLYLTVQDDLNLVLGEEAIAREALRSAIDARTGGNRDERIFLRADAAVDYGDLMEVMNALRDAGYLKIALVGLENTGAAPAAGAAPQP